MAENIDMSQVPDLKGIAKVRDWVKANFLLKSEASEMMASKIKISFGSDFVGQTYTVTGGANETYTGLVPESQIVTLNIKEMDAEYVISCASENGTVYDRTVTVGNYYGIYPFNFVSFLAHLVVKADAGATIRATGTKKTYTSVADANGYCTLSIGFADTYSVTATLNGETTVPVTVAVTTSGETYSCIALFLTIVGWADGTDDEIAAMLDAARAGTIDLQTDAGWAVGDVRTIQTKEFTDNYPKVHVSQSIDIVISSFEDYNECGCVMQFDFKDSLATGVRINATNTVAGGYRASEMFTDTLPKLANALPSWLSSRLLEFSVHVKASAGSLSDVIDIIEGNKLALRSEIEIFGVVNYTTPGEGTQIEYYKTAENRVKRLGHTGAVSSWWERSPSGKDTAYFCYINANGGSAHSRPNIGYGLAPFGCI